MLLTIFLLSSTLKTYAQQSVTLNAVGSAGVTSIAPDDNFSTGLKNNVTAKYLEDHDEGWIIFKFDTSSIPKEAIIHSATLGFYHEGAWSNRNSIEMRVLKITQPWKLAEVTWNNKPNYTVDESTSVITINKEGGYKKWRVDSLVKDWVRNRDVNFGAYIQIANFNDGPWISVFEAENSANKPRLTIQYFLSSIQPISHDIIKIDPQDLLEADLKSPTPTPTEIPDPNQTIDPVADDLINSYPASPTTTDSAEIESGDIENGEEEAKLTDEEMPAESELLSIAGVYFDPDSFAGKILASVHHNNRQLKFLFYALLVVAGIILGIFSIKEIIANKRKGISFTQSVKSEWEKFKAFITTPIIKKPPPTLG